MFFVAIDDSETLNSQFIDSQFPSNLQETVEEEEEEEAASSFLNEQVFHLLFDMIFLPVLFEMFCYRVHVLLSMWISVVAFWES